MAEETTNVAETPEVVSNGLNAGNPAPVEDKNASPEEVEDDLDPKVLKERLKEKQNREINLSKRLREAEAELNKFKTSQLSEQEKIVKERDDLKGISESRENGLKSVLLQNKLSELKSQFGLRSTRSIGKLISTEGLAYDLDELNVAGVEDALKQLKKTDPDLFIIGGTDGGRGNDARPSSSMNDLLRGAAGRRAA